MSARKQVGAQKNDVVADERRSYLAGMGHFKKLRAWEHARRLAVLSKAAIARLPDYELDGLANQWKRASYSVVLNIAEGASRRGSKDFRTLGVWELL